MALTMTGPALRQSFQARFQHAPSAVFRAPGRANIIGEHVDYSSKFKGPGYGHNYSMPFALPFGVCVAAAKTQNGKVTVHSANFDGSMEFDPKNLPSEPSKTSWENYVYGVFEAARQAGLPITSGLDMQISGDVPIGAGISSSAALTVAQHLALNRLFSWDVEKTTIARLAQAAEHSRFVGTKCGLLDQTASLFSQDGKAILIDYGNMDDIKPVDLSPLTSRGYKFLLVNSGVERLLGGTYYNDRRAELESAGRVLARAIYPRLSYVSQYTLADLACLQESFSKYVDMDDVPFHMKDMTKEDASTILYKRARFVLAEKQRTWNFFNALTGSVWIPSGDIPAFCSELVNGCGDGLSHDGDFQISTTVLRDADGRVSEERHYMDLLRGALGWGISDSEEYKNQPAPFGIRLMGGGGGGNLIALLPERYDTPALRRSVADAYSAAQKEQGYGTDYGIEFYEATPSAGAGEVLE